MKLNPDNPLVGAIFAFVGPRIEEVRKALVESQREQRSTEQAKRLQQEASRIEEIINQDFEAFRKRLQKVKAAAAKAGFDASDASAADQEDDDGDDDFLFGGEEPATVVGDGDAGTSGGGEGGQGGEPRRLNPIVTPDVDGKSTGHHEKRGGDRRRNGGGFQIEFDHQGEASARAIYQREKRTIYVNLDHRRLRRPSRVMA